MPLLEMNAIAKHFGATRALDGVTLSVDAGEFHAIVGENGAGKSTLMKVLSGVYPAGSFAGEIKIDGQQQRFRTVRDSEAAGVAIIFQELSLVPEMSVGENIFLGREPATLGVINWHKLYADASKLTRDLGLSIDPRLPINRLGIGQQQLVEIAKALSQDARILILDEPTAALTESEVETLFRILAALKTRGVGIIYISHKLNEVFQMSDRITILRDGKTVGTFDADRTSKEAVIAGMVGREVSDVFPEGASKSGDIAFECTAISAHRLGEGRKVVDEVSFNVRKGEILGIAGLMGSGRSELLMTLFGAWQGRRSGQIRVSGKPVTISSPKDAIKNGVAFVTEDRKRYGLVLDQTIKANLTLASLKRTSDGFLLNPARESAAARASMTSLRIKAPSAESIVGDLSGGNQQKVVLGKWLTTEPTVLFLDEPTRGIDVGAKQEIYAMINRLAAEGLAIVLVSSELPEVLGLSDRVLVLHNGRVAAEFNKNDATAENVMAAATANA